MGSSEGKQVVNTVKSNIKNLRSQGSRLSIICVVAMLLSAIIAPRVAGAQTTVCAENIVVQRGQSLASIAARIFGTQDAAADIMAATNALAAVDASYTRIDDPDAVEAGWKLCIPARLDSQQADPTPRRGSSSGTGGTRSANDVGLIEGVADGTAIALEQNHALLQSTLAARMGEDGVHPLSIEYLRRQTYPGSELTIEATLPAGRNYDQYLVSYESEGLKLYAAMTVPQGIKPATGWPVIIFNHGYIDPVLYSPTTRYTEYVDALAANGYIVLRPDLRGHGNSEGVALGAYGDPGYVIDVLNALASIQQYADADPDRIGMWGHSMGGYITARAMVVNEDIQAGVIWSGVVAPYEQLVAAWDATYSTIAEGEMPIDSVLPADYGTPAENPGFWLTLSANSYTDSLSGPMQLHHGTADTSVPVAFSDTYYADMIAADQVAEYYLYTGDDHNISAGFTLAMQRTLSFFNIHVKQSTASLAQQLGTDSAQ